MKINLRSSEIDSIIYSLEMAINPDYPNSDSANATYIRLIKKLSEAQGRED